MASKGQKFKHWSKEENKNCKKSCRRRKIKLRRGKEENILSTGMIRNWIKLYIEQGENALENKKKPGNPLSKYSRRKTLTKEEQLEYENMKLRIENELLKKGYLMKGDGTLVRFMK